MRDCDGMYKNILLPGVTVKSRHFNGMDVKNDVDQPKNTIQYSHPRNVSHNKDAQTLSQSQKGFYSWLSSPKTVQNSRKVNNVAVITPTQHHS